jgi:hypothetical protein
MTTLITYDLVIIIIIFVINHQHYKANYHNQALLFISIHNDVDCDDNHSHHDYRHNQHHDHHHLNNNCCGVPFGSIHI